MGEVIGDGFGRGMGLALSTLNDMGTTLLSSIAASVENLDPPQFTLGPPQRSRPDQVFFLCDIA
jgi:hypothetical protein